jgi:hypothetical protein
MRAEDIAAVLRWRRLVRDVANPDEYPTFIWIVRR